MTWTRPSLTRCGGSSCSNRRARPRSRPCPRRGKLIPVPDRAGHHPDPGDELQPGPAGRHPGGQVGYARVGRICPTPNWLIWALCAIVAADIPRAQSRQGVFRRGGASPAVTLRHDICMPTGGVRRSSRVPVTADVTGQRAALSEPGQAAGRGAPDRGRWALVAGDELTGWSCLRVTAVARGAGLFFLWGWDREVPVTCRGFT